jgi:large subunit ribosomal protein L24
MKNKNLKINNLKIKTGDNVQILLGKDRGKSGKILRVWTKENKVLVENINIYKRHVKKTAQHEGGVLDIPKPVNSSNVSLICPSCKKTTRVGIKIEGNNKMRICKKCNEEIKNVKKGEDKK